MRHGRDHEEREQKSEPPRHNNVPPEGPDEANAAGPAGRGSDVAPTRQAAERERLRHEKQRALGVEPAGEEGRLHQRRDASTSREQLDRAAEEADDEVTAPHRGPDR